jgi:hypothetical protein
MKRSISTPREAYGVTRAFLGARFQSAFAPTWIVISGELIKELTERKSTDADGNLIVQGKIRQSRGIIGATKEPCFGLLLLSALRAKKQRFRSSLLASRPEI